MKIYVPNFMQRCRKQEKYSEFFFISMTNEYFFSRITAHLNKYQTNRITDNSEYNIIHWDAGYDMRVVDEWGRKWWMSENENNGWVRGEDDG